MQKYLVYIFIAFLFSSCATLGSSYNVSVDSISSYQTIDNKKYIILSGIENVNSNDLQFQEYANYVNKALISKGYEVVSNIEDATLAIILSYGIGDPQKQYYTYNSLTYGQTGVISNTYSYGNYSTTTTTPTYGLTTKQTVGSRTTFTRYILLVAYDLQTYIYTEQEIQVWKTEIISTGSSGDLRRVFPVLIAGAKPYIGENTGRKVKICISENNPSVLEIKGISTE